MGAFAVLAILAATTLSGPIRGATLLFLGALALKTWIALLRERQQQADEGAARAGGDGQETGRGE